MRVSVFMAAGAVALLGCAASGLADPAPIPFDFSRSEIAISIKIKGVPLYAPLDTALLPHC